MIFQELTPFSLIRIGHPFKEEEGGFRNQEPSIQNIESRLFCVDKEKKCSGK